MRIWKVSVVAWAMMVLRMPDVESSKGEVACTDSKGRAIQWNKGGEIYRYECLVCHHWLYEGFWAWYCENCDDEAYYKSIDKCKVIDRTK